MHCSMPGFAVLHYLPELCLSNSCLLSQWCHPAVSSSAAPFSFCLQYFPESESFPVSWLLALRIMWSKYWSFSVSPSNEYSGLISFRFDRFDFLAVQGTRKSLLQHHSLKASIFWCLVFFKVRLSHLYMTTGKTVALTVQTFEGKVTSLLFNTLPRFVTAFFPRSKCLHGCRDFGAQEGSLSLFPLYLHLFALK